MDIFDLVESLAVKNRHNGPPPGHPTHPGQRQSPQVFNPVYSDNTGYAPPSSGRRHVYFPEGHTGSALGGNAVPAVSIYSSSSHEGNPHNARRPYKDNEGSFFHRFRGSPNVSRGSSPERGSNTSGGLSENGIHPVPLNGGHLSPVARPRKGSEPNIMQAGSRTRSGSQNSEMIHLPEIIAGSSDGSDLFDPRMYQGDNGTGGLHPRLHRRTSSQSNINDYRVPAHNTMATSSTARVPEKERKTSKTTNIFRLARRRPKEMDTAAAPDARGRWPNEAALDVDSLYNTYDEQMPSFRQQRAGNNEVNQHRQVRKRSSMIRVDPAAATNHGGVDPFYGHPPPRKASIQHSEMMARAPSAYHQEPSDPNLLSTKHHEKQYCIRVYRPDGTFATVTCGLGTTTAELCQSVARKFFLTDTSRYVMILRRNNLERVLGAHEHPAFLQKRWLEQAGYEEKDNLPDHGREDNSYLFQYMFGEPPSHVGLPVPKDADIDPTAARHFDFQARNLPTIPKSFFRYAPGIITLNLSQNHSLSLPIEFAQQCNQLRELRLANNDYKRVPEAVRHLATLSHLDLACNRLAELDHAQLDQVHPLTSLMLQNNRLTELPPSFGHFVSLTSLYLSNNRFDHVPRVICEIRSLTDLDMSFNRISVIPDEIGQLTRLQRLLLVSNRITGTLPRTFDQLVELRELDLRQNGVQDLGVLASMCNLTLLFLDYNTVSTLTCEFRSLQRLTLHKNHLTSFKPSVVPTTSLTSLDLSKSKLPQLPDAMFEQLPKLERLILDDNKFVSVPSSICTLRQLTFLSCTNNLLTSLPVEIYLLDKLSTLNVYGNNLERLPQEIWYCQRLSTLNCSSNLLKTFPDPPAPGQKPPAMLPSVGSALLSASNGSLGTAQTLMAGNSSSTSVASSLSSSSTLVTMRQASSSVPSLASALRHLLLGDNGLTDDVFSPLAHFKELRTLNLSFNDIYDIPAGGLYHHPNLVYLHLSGNQITSLPAEEVGRLRSLRELFVNGNKLHALPAELGKIVHLQVLDVGSNVLKYNICNWPYDWNWNWNLELKYLNLSNNKRLEIKVNRDDIALRNRNLTDFSTLHSLRVLGLMDITLMVTPPDQLHDKRIRTSASEVNYMSYGMADTLGRSDMLCAWDLVVSKFRGKDDECLFALFDGRMGSKFNGGRGCRITMLLNDKFPRQFEQELRKLRKDETVEDALKRTFLNVNRDLGAVNMAEARTGAAALVVYITGTTLYAANVGDTLAALSRQRCDALPLSMKHTPWLPEEIARIQAAGGYVSHQGLVNDELEVSRSFGHFHLSPIVNANPHIVKLELSDDDEFVIMASKSLWNRMSYQTAVDVARTESDDLMLAAQKLRDFAIAYGADESVMVMMIGVGDLFDGRTQSRRLANCRQQQYKAAAAHFGLVDPATAEEMRAGVKKNRRVKENLPGDSTLRRLQQEVEAPTGLVALVFTDIKNSTFLWETLPKAMQSAIKTHNEIMRRYLRNIGGYEVKTEGDAFMVCFPSVVSAMLWCLTVQLQLLQADWPQEILDSEDGKEVYWETEDGERELIYRGLSVRMGIHWGSPVCEEDPITRRMDYFGPMVNRSARISGVADGGQICVSQDVISEVMAVNELIDSEEALDSVRKDLRRQALALRKLGFVFINIGERKLKGLEGADILSLTYPQALKNRWEYSEERTRAAAAPILYPPMVQILDPDSVRQLGFLCLRLERITSGAVTSKRKSRIDYLNGLLTFHVKDNAEDEELLRITENLITRIENATSALYLRRMEGYSHVLEEFGRAADVDMGEILEALRECLSQRLARPISPVHWELHDDSDALTEYSLTDVDDGELDEVEEEDEYDDEADFTTDSIMEAYGALTGGTNNDQPRQARASATNAGE